MWCPPKLKNKMKKCRIISGAKIVQQNLYMKRISKCATVQNNTTTTMPSRTIVATFFCAAGTGFN